MSLAWGCSVCERTSLPLGDGPGGRGLEASLDLFGRGILGPRRPGRCSRKGGPASRWPHPFGSEDILSYGEGVQLNEDQSEALEKGG